MTETTIPDGMSTCPLCSAVVPYFWQDFEFLPRLSGYRPSRDGHSSSCSVPDICDGFEESPDEVRVVRTWLEQLV